MASSSAADRVRTDPRISRRRKAVARGKRRKLIGSTVAAVVGAALVWTAFWSPLLDVRRVQVVGAEHTSASDVRAAVDLGSDDNLLLVSTGDVAEAAEKLPWVRSADVHRRLPGTVRIKLVERRAALVVTAVSGTWTIDPRGRVLEEGAVSKRLPTLSGAALGTLEVGERIVTSEVKTGLAVWRSLPRRLREDVASVVAPTSERVAVALQNGMLIRFGGADRLAAKNKVLLVLLRRLDAQGRDATYIDVSVPSTPAVGPAPIVTPTPAASPVATIAPTPTP